MEQHAALLGGIVLLTALASLGSYYAYQWLAAGGRGSPLPWFICGIAIVLISIGFFSLALQLGPLSRISREELPSNRVGILSGTQAAQSNPSNELRSPPLAESTPRVAFHSRAGSSASNSVNSERRPLALSQPGAIGTAVDATSDPSRASGIEHYAWLEDQSFWGATKCVLAVRQDPEDAATWILINDCQVDVRILIASCESPLEYCNQRGSRNWSYVRGGLYLPAKVKRSVSAEEQTVHGLHLRYVACRINVPAITARVQHDDGALRHVGIQSCSEEVRTLSEIGAQSGSQLEELVNEPVPDNPCCQKQFVQ
jgi:hypothetical protein